MIMMARSELSGEIISSRSAELELEKTTTNQSPCNVSPARRHAHTQKRWKDLKVEPAAHADDGLKFTK